MQINGKNESPLVGQAITSNHRSLVPRRSRPLTSERKVRTRAWEPVCVAAGERHEFRAKSSI